MFRQTHLLKVLLNIIPAPSWITHILPILIDRPTASAVRQAVDRTGSSKTEPTVLGDGSVVQTGYRFGCKVPVHRRV